MKLFFQCKNPSISSHSVDPVLLELNGNPADVATLISLIVEKIVEEYNRKPKNNPDYHSTPIKTHEESEIQHLAKSGKIAFGLIYNERSVSPKDAVKTALEGYADGMFKIFLNNELLGELKSEIEVEDGDLLTVVRLSFLSGRII